MMKAKKNDKTRKIEKKNCSYKKSEVSKLRSA